MNPGIGLDQLRDDRKGTNTPNDYADQRGYNTALGFTQLWENGTEAVIDGGYRVKNQKAFFDDYDFGGAFANYLDSELKTWSITPRLIIPHELFTARRSPPPASITMTAAMTPTARSTRTPVTSRYTALVLNRNRAACISTPRSRPPGIPA